ncbi:MAG: VanZ family protein [Candidatus Acidiferrum sp.]|jgi:VanZ family protein
MVAIQKQVWSTNRLGTACVLLWVAMMVATLWPFNPHPRNRVEWLEQSEGVNLDKAGRLVSNRAFPVEDAPSGHGCSMEIWLSAEEPSSRDTIFTFYASERPPHFALRQYESAVVISYEVWGARNEQAEAAIYVEDVFKGNRPTLLTVTSGVQGINVFVDGAIRRTVSDGHLSAHDFSGKLIVGTSPWSYNPWRGRLYGLAVYARELEAAQVREHYAEWTSRGEIVGATSDATVARFLFKEHTGNVIRNEIPGAPDLIIPRYFELPEKAMLGAPFSEPTPLSARINDMASNIVGFVPFGMLVYLYLVRGQSEGRAALLTVLIGGTASLFIEFLQAFIPQRDSDMTDIISNTLGTILAVMLLQPRPIKVMLEKFGIFRSRSVSRTAEG